MARQDNISKTTGSGKILLYPIALAMLIFIVDIIVPLGYAVWVFYMVPLLMSAQSQKRNTSYFFAASLSALVIINTFIGPIAIPFYVVLFNRTAAIISFWIIAVLLERYKVTSELRALSEEKFRKLFNAMSTAVQLNEVIFDAEGRAVDTILLDANPVFEEQTGLSRGQMIGRRIKETLPDVEQAWFDRYGEVVRTGKPMHFEEYNRSVDKWFDVYASPMSGKRLVVVFNDITGRKKAEEALRESHEQLEQRVRERTLELEELNNKLRQEIKERKKAEEAVRASEATLNAFFENSPVTLAIRDEAMRYIKIDAHYAKEYLGKEREKVLGKTLKEASTEIDSKVKPLLRRVLEKGETVQTETVYDLLGKKRSFIANYFPVPLANGKMGIGNISVDITERKNAEEDLVRAKEIAEKRAKETEEGRRILISVMRHIKEGITIADAPDGRIRMLSDHGVELIGRRKEELVEISPEMQPERWGIYEKDGKTLAKGEELPLTRAIEKGESVEAEEWFIKRPDGSMRTFSFSTAPILDSSNKVVGGVSGWRDITEAKKAEDTLRRNEYELRTLVDNSPDIIFRMNRQLQYVYVNPAYERITGLMKEQFVGRTNNQLGMSQKMIEFWQSSVQGVIGSGQEHSLEFDIISFFGTRYFLARLIPEYEKSGLVETVLVIARDITERKHAEEQIRYISFHDEVTGLFNRAFFEEEIRRVDTERELPISIIVGDVNNLKLSNDVFGHEEGDKLLKAIADIFKKACRKNDIIARWGGDEYAVILPRTDFDTANEVCGRAKQAARATKGTVIEPGVALGVATKDNKDQNIYQTIRQAEERMYQNKLDEAKKNEDIVYSSLFECAREKNPGLDDHTKRSIALADTFAKELNLSESQQDDLRLLIKLHDIGAAVIPGEILGKPGRLTQQEWEIVKKHPEAGLRIVKTFVDTARISDEVFSHGERWDGTGYPRGLKEKEIPYLARVFQVIDVFDVMTHSRPYASIFTKEEAIEELRRNAGKQFDPGLVDMFIAMITSKEHVPV